RGCLTGLCGKSRCGRITAERDGRGCLTERGTKFVMNLVPLLLFCIHFKLEFHEMIIKYISKFIINNVNFKYMATFIMYIKIVFAIHDCIEFIGNELFTDIFV